jgi:hypothetical protein
MTKPACNTRLGGSRPAAVVVDDACPSCGTTMKQARSRLAYLKTLAA